MLNISSGNLYDDLKFAQETLRANLATHICFDGKEHPWPG